MNKMDAIDPRIDYLKIDEWMTNNNCKEVMKYCKRLGCDLSSVIQIWFEASDASGIMVGNSYFDQYTIRNTAQLAEYYGWGMKYKLLPSRSELQIIATSNFMYLLDTMDFSSKIEVNSKCINGGGFVIETKETDQDCSVAIEMEWWKFKHI
jgi:hypothetical protein